MPPELSKLKKLDVLDIGWGYDEVDCSLNAWLWTLAQSYSVWDTIAEVCENVPNEFCIQSSAALSKIIMRAVPAHTCSSDVIANANFTLWFPTADNTPWQNTDKTQPYFYRCKMGYTGSDCLTTVPLTLYERMFWYLEQEQLIFDIDALSKQVKEFAWKLYFNAGGNFYSIDSNSNVEIITWGLFWGIIEKDNKLYFTANHSIYGTELHILDSSWALNVIDTYASGSSYPSEITFFNNTLYFRAYTADYWQEIYYVNSSNQSVPVEVLWGNSRSNVGWLTEFNNKLYFTCDTSAEWWELCSIDTSNVLSRVNPIPGTVWSIERIFLVYNGRLYFKWYNRWIWDELYYIDTSNTLGSYDINSWVWWSSLEKVMTFNNTLYLMAYNSSIGQELHSVNTSNILTPINISSWVEWSYGYGWPIEFNNKLFYNYDDGTAGWEIYSVDISNSPTLYDIYTGSNSSQPYNYAVFNNKLYFVAQNATIWRELFAIDAAWVVTSHDITPWIGDSEIWSTWVMDNSLYFFNYLNPTNVYFLKTDGTIWEFTNLNIKLAEA